MDLMLHENDTTFATSHASTKSTRQMVARELFRLQLRSRALGLVFPDLRSRSGRQYLGIIDKEVQKLSMKQEVCTTHVFGS